ncbi:MAG: hypothetical protein KAS38_22835, partial [Anaerolineales bacterium]|nr:hypothetical protein [Anaerolineales bacterium]
MTERTKASLSPASLATLSRLACPALLVYATIWSPARPAVRLSIWTKSTCTPPVSTPINIYKVQ